MSSQATTPSQTVGPFYALPGGIPWADGPEVVPPETPNSFVLRGFVYDGTGESVPDAVVETWQADSTGRFEHPNDPRQESSGWQGFGRCATNTDGQFWIRTVKPGPLPTPDARTEAPHLTVTVLARGMFTRVVTRVYFPDETAANDADPVLSTVPAQRRGTLVALADGADYRFDIRLQGETETVFFDV